MTRLRTIALVLLSAAASASAQSTPVEAATEDAGAVRRLVAAGTPQLAEDAGRRLIGQDTEDPLPWAVVGAVLLDRRPVEAIPYVARAGDLNDREPFVMRTAARLLAFVDVRRPKISDRGRTQLSTLRHNMKGQPLFDEAYTGAAASYRAEQEAERRAADPPPPQVVVVASEAASPPPPAPQAIVVHIHEPDPPEPSPIVYVQQAPRAYPGGSWGWTRLDPVVRQPLHRGRVGPPRHVSPGGPLFGAAAFQFGAAQPPVPPALVSPRAAGTLAAPALPMIQPRPRAVSIPPFPRLGAVPPPPAPPTHPRRTPKTGGR
jgi:hypothetical protein